jgi:uncharacterized repeat protein (TIGR01451 family)
VGIGGGGTQAADVQVSGFATTGQPAAGSAFGYVFQVKNGGSALASSVSFSDTLPAGVVPFGAASASGLCSMSGQSISCSLGDIQVGQTVLVGIAAYAPNVSGTYTDTGSAATTSVESSLSNNAANVAIKIN